MLQRKVIHRCSIKYMLYDILVTWSSSITGIDWIACFEHSRRKHPSRSSGTNQKRKTENRSSGKFNKIIWSLFIIPLQIILPLSLGLILLALALVMVYLRYRQARHLAGLGIWFDLVFDRKLNRKWNIRYLEPFKGQSQYKQLPKEDTDYLVNGMYM